jgi:D-alanyl-D-alanine dipeptidase
MGGDSEQDEVTDDAQVSPEEQAAMDSDFDEFTERAAIDFSDAPAEAIQNRTRLIQAMATEGFTPYRYEWWHYDHPAWENYPVLDLAFSEIEAR